MSVIPVTPRTAATLILLRDGAHGLETLMIERHAGLRFAPGALVFPGGALCDDDHANGSDGDLPLRLAAIRECFEECGILLARAREGAGTLDAEAVARLTGQYQQRLLAGEIGFNAMLAAEGLDPGIRPAGALRALGDAGNTAQTVRHPVLPGPCPIRPSRRARRVGGGKVPMGPSPGHPAGSRSGAGAPDLRHADEPCPAPPQSVGRRRAGGCLQTADRQDHAGVCRDRRRRRAAYPPGYRLRPLRLARVNERSGVTVSRNRMHFHLSGNPSAGGTWHIAFSTPGVDDDLT